jgi:acylphosphatase
MTDARLLVLVEGRVQGVGFRYWVQERARALGLAGRAVNRVDGRVEIEVEGPRAAGAALLAELGAGPSDPGPLDPARRPPPGYVRDVQAEWLEPAGLVGFRIG